MKNLNKKIQTLFNEGLAAQDIEQFDIAMAAYTKVIKLDPLHIEALYNLAIILHDLGDLEKAIIYYQKTISLKPDLASAYKNIGDALFTQQHLDRAVKAYEKALSIDPLMAESWYNLGLAKRDQQKFKQVISAWNKALSIRPEYTAATKSLAKLLQAQGEYKKSLDLFQELLKKTPNSVEIKQKIAELHLFQGNLTLAQAICKTAHNNQFPETATLSYIEALIEIKQGEPQTAIKILHQALKDEPRSVKINSTLLYTMLLAPASSPVEYYKKAKKWWQTLGLSEFEKISYNHRRLPLEHRKLKLGFISSDLRRHSVSYFLLPLLKHIDKNDISIYCYADNSRTDEYSHLIQEQSCCWHSIFGLADETVGKMIEHDKIDILVELNGHTAYNRLTLMAQKPAPIQISWLGYPGSTGICNGTFRLSDDFVDPKGCEKFYCEPILRIESPFICYEPHPETTSIKISTKSSNRQITFGSFNNPTKINNTVISAWADILNSTPNSSLCLKYDIFKDQGCRETLLNKFLAHNISSNRINLLPVTQTTTQHFNTYNDIDIALDTFPYNGTTTTCEALWMGVPVITIPNKSHASRVGADILTVVGCPELIAKTQEEYRNKAIALAKDWSQLSHYNKNLRNYMLNSSLMDGKAFATKFTQMLKGCWETWWNSCDAKKGITVRNKRDQNVDSQKRDNMLLTMQNKTNIETEQLITQGKLSFPAGDNHAAIKTTPCPKISIIVVTYNSLEDIQSCIRSIQAKTPTPYELIIIDNNSSDETAKYIKTIKDIKLILNTENKGFSAATNQGINISTGDYIVLLNPDTIVTKNWAHRMITHFHPGVGAVGPISNYVAGRQKIKHYVKFDRNKPLHIDTLAERCYAENLGRNAATKLLIGFCLMIKRDVMEKVGLLDEDLFLGSDDLEYSHRLQRQGFKLLVATDTFIYHKGQASFQTEPSEHMNRLTQESQDTLYSKLEKIYGKENVPSAMNLWGMNWFQPQQLNKNEEYQNKVSIIMLTYNQLEYTKKCIESIFNYTEIHFQLIVVDNGSTDKTIDYLTNIKKNAPSTSSIKIIKNGKNLGFAAGNNQGLSLAKGEYIVLINNDVVVTPGWLEKMISCAEKSPKIGMVGPMTNYAPGLQLVKDIKYDPDSLSELNHFARDYAIKHFQEIKPVFRVTGFCMLIKKTVIEKIGGLDERYGLGNFEDDDFSIRAKLAGFQSWIAGDCFVHHFGSRTFKGAGIDYHQSLQENWEIFKKKWEMPRTLPYGSYNLSHLGRQSFNPEKDLLPITTKEKR